MSDIQIQGSPDNLSAQQVTIASGGSTSEVIATQGRALVGIVMPSAWTAAKFGLKAGITPNAMLTAYDNAGNPLLATVAASEFIAFPLDQAVYAPFIQATSVDSSNVAVTQGQATILTLLFRKFLN